MLNNIMSNLIGTDGHLHMSKIRTGRHTGPMFMKSYMYIIITLKKSDIVYLRAIFRQIIKIGR